MKIFKAIIDSFADEFRLVLSNVGVLLFLIGLPLAYPPIYSLIYNAELVRDVPLVVVDHDRTADSRKLVRQLDATQEAHVIGYAADLPEARRAMDSRDCFGILEIPAGFQRNQGRGQKSDVILFADMTLVIRYKSLLTAATKVSSNFGSTLKTADSGLIGTIMPEDPMPVISAYLGDITGGYDSFLMPGILVLIVQQCVIMAVAMAGGIRRENPRFRYPAGPLGATLGGRTLCYLVWMILPALLMLYYIPLMFRFPQAANMFQVFLFILPMLISAVMLGFSLQGFMSESESVFMIWVGLSIACLYLSGLTWPRYAMPDAWKVVADLIPSTFGILGFVRMNSNGADLAQVANEYTALWIQAAGYTLLAIAVQYYLRKKALRRA